MSNSYPNTPSLCTQAPSRCRHVRIKSLEERFWAKVCKQPNGCWLWQGALSTAGYGTFNLGRRGAGYEYAHRISYAWAYGDMPAGQELDHLCRIRRCVNPQHLESVSHRINVFRGDAPTIRIAISGKCHNGHEINTENMYFRKDRPGKWNCRVCRRERRKAGYAN